MGAGAPRGQRTALSAGSWVEDVTVVGLIQRATGASTGRDRPDPMHTKLWYHMHQEAYMRTTLNLDTEAVTAALEVSPGQTKTQVINDALREYARRRRVRGLLEFRGKMRWEGNLDDLRQRKPARR